MKHFFCDLQVVTTAAFLNGIQKKTCRQYRDRFLWSFTWSTLREPPSFETLFCCVFLWSRLHLDHISVLCISEPPAEDKLISQRNKVQDKTPYSSFRATLVHFICFVPFLEKRKIKVQHRKRWEINNIELTDHFNWNKSRVLAFSLLTLKKTGWCKSNRFINTLTFQTLSQKQSKWLINSDVNKACEKYKKKAQYFQAATSSACNNMRK